MKKYFSLDFVSLLFLSLLFSVGCQNTDNSTTDSETSTDTYREAQVEANEEMSKIERIDKAFELEFRKTVDPNTGTVPRERLRQAHKVIKEKLPILAERGNEDAQWEDRGPYNVGGRTRAIFFDAADASNNTFFAGGAGGGVWFTENFKDAEPVWQPVDDYLQNIAIGSMMQSPSNPDIIYVGTGEGWQNADAVRGEGIFKMTITRGVGASIASIAVEQLASTINPDFHYTQEIAVADDGTVYAATNAGLMRSTDGGTNWTNVLNTGEGGASVDFAGSVIIAANGDVWATFGKILQTGSVFKSVENGAATGEAGSWTNITGIVTGFRLELALAPSDPNTAYILAQDAGLDCLSYYYTTDGGTLWVRNNAPVMCDNGRQVPFTRLQAWYDLICAVDPADPSIIYVGGVDGLRLENANTPAYLQTQITSWVGGSLCPPMTNNQFVHADHHAIIFEPGTSDHMVWGTDGGLYYTQDSKESPVLSSGASPTFVSKNTGYNVTQYYGVGMANEFGVTDFLAGAQDNGTQRYTEEGFGNTTMVTGGDGCFVHVDQDNGDIQVSSYVYNSYWITNDRWESNTRVEVGSQIGEFVNPTDLDSDANIMYCCADAGSMIRIDDVGGANSATTVTVNEFGTGKITTVAVSPNMENRVFFGLDDGKIIMLDNAHSPAHSAMDLTGDLPSGGTISCIAVEDGNDNHLLVTKSNYGLESVFETTDGGTTWVDKEGDLPDMPVRWAIFNPNDANQALLATEVGVWSTDDLSAAEVVWMPTGAAHGFPNVSTHMLKSRKVDNLIIAGTHGRGIFSTPSYLEKIAVTFGKSGNNVVENNTDMVSAGDCPQPFQELSIEVSITKSSGATSIPFSVDGASTATAGSDYELLTASPLSFNGNGGNAESQHILIRIFDDGTIDGSENIRLVLGDLPIGFEAGFFTEHDIKIQDDDVPPALTAGTGAIPILTENFDAGSFTEGWEVITKNGTGPNTWGVGTSDMMGTINTAVVTFNTLQPIDKYDSSNGTDSSNDVILRSPKVDARGLSDVHLSFDWAAGGESDAALADPAPFDYGQLTYSFDGVDFFPLGQVFIGAGPGVPTPLVEFYDESIALLDNTEFYIGFRWINDVLVTGVNSLAIDNVTITAIPKRLETQVNASTFAAVNTNETVYFYSDDDGELMAKIEASAADLGCVAVSVSQEGTDAPIFMNGVRSSKVIQMDNATNSAYTVTVYYTTTELEALPAPENLSLAKVNGDINNPTSTITDENPTVTPIMDAADESVIGYAFTSSNFTGFSSFFLTNATSLSVDWLDIKATLVDDNHTVLDWAVATETNNKGFEVERSFDGKTFEYIGFVEGKGNSQVQQQYQFKDFDLKKGMHYYRLKQVDYSGKVDYSKVVSVVVSKKEVDISLFPNPATDRISLTTSEILEDAKIDLLDVSGKWLKTLSFDSQNAVQQFEIDQLPAGTYWIRIETLTGVYSEKFVKQ